MRVSDLRIVVVSLRSGFSGKSACVGLPVSSRPLICSGGERLLRGISSPEFSRLASLMMMAQSADAAHEGGCAGGGLQFGEPPFITLLLPESVDALQPLCEEDVSVPFRAPRLKASVYQTSPDSLV